MCFEVENGYRGTIILADEAKDNLIITGINMPLYEYFCKKCGQSFVFTMTVSEHEKKRVQCPHCNGNEIVPQFQSFFAKTSKKS